MSGHNISISGNGLRLTAINPTPFFRQTDDGLRQGVDITLTSERGHDTLALAVTLAEREVRVPLAPVEAGISRQRAFIPEIDQARPVTFRLLVREELLDQQELAWQPGRHWQVYLVHGSHHDLGYTDLPSNVLREHDTFWDAVLDACDETADWPAESRFRYVAEQAWSVLHYIRHRPAGVVERLMRHMREGRIELTALPGNETSELCGHEEQVRLLYPAFRLKQRFGIPIRTAELNDIPGVSWGLASVLAGAGIRYFSAGIPDYFAWGIQVHPHWDEEAILPRRLPGAFWWEGPDGRRVLFWYAGGSISGPGLWTYPQAEADLARYLSGLAESGYAHDSIRVKFHGANRDNAPPDVRLSRIVREWNSRWAFPRLIISTNTEFFERFEQAAGDRLPVLRGDLPNTDYTVGAISTPKETGVNRLAHDVLGSAEKLAACAAIVSDYVYPADTLAEAYDCALLYDEHTWGMAQPIGPAQDACWSQKSELAYRGAALAHDVVAKSTHRIADQVRLPDSGYHLVVLNPLNWTRTELVRARASAAEPASRPLYWRPGGQPGAPAQLVSSSIQGRPWVSLPAELLERPFELVDVATGRVVPCQVNILDDPLAARPWAAQHHALGHTDPHSHPALNYERNHLCELIFLAQDLPPLGYRTYRIRPCDGWPEFASTLRSGEDWLENRFYRVELDPATGAIRSLFDKESGREWVDLNAPHGFNQLVVRSPRAGAEPVEASPRPPGGVSLRCGSAGPVAASLVIRSSACGCPQVAQEITLCEGVKRIELATRILRDATPLLELHIAFPFALSDPQFAYEASNAVIEPVRDQLPGTNTDAYAAQHWVSVYDRASGVAWGSLEAPIVELGGLWPGYVSQAHHGVTPPGYGHAFLRSPEELRHGHIYSHVMNNNFRTNFQPVQVTDALFRYVVTTHDGQHDRDRARALGWEAAVCPVTAYVIGPQSGPLPAAGTFCQVDAPGILLLTLKAAEDGDGLILRLAETGGQDRRTAVHLPYFGIREAWKTNLVEEDEERLPCSLHRVDVPLSAHSMTTVRCRGSRRFPATTMLASY